MAESGSALRVGILGANSMVGTALLPMLSQHGWQVTAFSRRANARRSDLIEWQQLGTRERPRPPGLAGHEIALWACITPVWVLPDYFSMLEEYGARRVVVLSSTSRFTKGQSTDLAEQALALRLAEAEERVSAWAHSRGVEWVVLRPTLIYGLGRDKNICEIASFIRRFHVFPLYGKACGLRQPVHAADIAAACLSALCTPDAANRAYNVSGGETLAYRDMVTRVFSALGIKPRLLAIPLWSFRLAVALLRWSPRFRHWSAAMAERMAQDLVFDHSDATRDLAFSPRPFRLTAADLPG